MEAPVGVKGTSKAGADVAKKKETALCHFRAKALAATLEFICGGEPTIDVVVAWREFADLHECAIKSSIDPKGIAIRIPELNRDPTSADHEINTLIRGALRGGSAIKKVNSIQVCLSANS